MVFRFRFQAIRITHPGLRDLISSSWSSSIDCTHPMQLLGAKLKRLWRDLKVWNRDVFGYLDMNISQASSSLQEVQAEIANQGISNDLHRQELAAHEALDHCLKQ